MQFGIGLLGANFNQEAHDQLACDDKRPPHPNFHSHAQRYAAALAARTIRAEPPTAPDLTDAGIVAGLCRLSRPVRPSEAVMVRAAFHESYL